MRILKRSKNRIAVVKIDGVISDSDSYGTDRAKIVGSLEEAVRRKARGIVLRVNSPGGTVAACQEIFAAVERMKGKSIPVVASMGDIAASGGVYVSMAASEIIASPGTITGSIGVIIKGNDLSALYNKVGVLPKVVKSGAHKDMLATYRSFSPEEQALL
jgi:protease-4